MFCEDQRPKQAIPVGANKDTKLSPGIFFFFFLNNRLSKAKTSALRCGLVNYFQFGILNLKTRTLAHIYSCQGPGCFKLAIFIIANC